MGQAYVALTMKRATGAVLAISLTFSSVAEAACVQTPDQASVGIRALQTDLMVAGLKCGAQKWNMFTGQFKTTIKSNADRLQSLFKKTYGNGGASRMNAFVTQLANDSSQRSNKSAEAEYCREQDKLFAQVMALTGKELEGFAVRRALAVPAPVTLCGPESEIVSNTPVVPVAAPLPVQPTVAKAKKAAKPN